MSAKPPAPDAPNPTASAAASHRRGANARSLRAEVEQLSALNADLRRAAEVLRAANQHVTLAAVRYQGRFEEAERRAALLEELDRIREDFIATASHELKGPLTSVRGYAQLLLRQTQARTPDPGQLERGLAIIEAQSALLAQRVDDLLDASRIQAGGYVPQTGPCELGGLVASVLTHLNAEDRERVDVALADAPLAGVWEGRRIEQVLANLLGNALKYSPAGERVRVAVELHDREIEVAVADRGMGLAAIELPLLFARFYRTTWARASGLPGTGLGLYICRGIIEAHGGRVWAESPGEGQGATFRFTLPAEPSRVWAEPGNYQLAERV